MGIFSKFEDRMEDTVEGAASRMSKAPISPVQIAKKAEKQMRRETMVGAGKQYAPTLYTVLVNPDDDSRLFGYYPTLAGETETYLSAKAAQEGLVMDGDPLVRFIVDEGLRHGKFDVVAELVAAPIVAKLREEEMERYGLSSGPRSGGQRQGFDQQMQPQQARGQGDQYGYDQPGQYGYDQPDQYGYDQPDQYGYDQPDQYGYSEYDQRDGYGGYDDVDPMAPSYDEPPERKPPLPYVPEEEIDRSIDYGEYTFNSEDFEDYRSGAIDPNAAPMAYNDDIASDAAENANNMFASPGMGPGAGAVDLGESGPIGGYQDQRRQLRQHQEDMHRAQQAQISQSRPANTVAFAGSAGEGQATPDRHAVRARLIDRRYQRPYDLAGTRITIGRESGNDIKVQDINASRRHAELTLNQQGLWVITDMRSTNGTRVNGVSVASQPLYPGDVITIGKSDFEFTLV